MAANDRDQLEARANAIMGRHMVRQQLQRRHLDSRAGSRKRWLQIAAAVIGLGYAAYLFLR